MASNELVSEVTIKSREKIYVFTCTLSTNIIFTPGGGSRTGKIDSYWYWSDDELSKTKINFEHSLNTLTPAITATFGSQYELGADVTISATANTSTPQRTGTLKLTLEESGKTITINITQTGYTKHQCTITINQLADADLSDNITTWEVRANKAPASDLMVTVGFTKKGNVTSKLSKGTLTGVNIYTSAGDTVKGVVITPSSDAEFNYVWDGNGTIRPDL